MIDSGSNITMDCGNANDRGLIKSRMEVYKSYIEYVNGTTASALDLGCGSGEWLELMVEMGINAYGVDTDSNVVEKCWKYHLNAKNQDAIKELSGLESESVNIITGFHLVEYLSFEQLQLLVCEALRVLTPNGILILEVSNPEFIVNEQFSHHYHTDKWGAVSAERLVALFEQSGGHSFELIGITERIFRNEGNYVACMQSAFKMVSRHFGFIGSKSEIRKSSENLQNYPYLNIKTLVKSHDEYVEELKKQINDLECLNEQSLVHLSLMENSFFWKITQPCRTILTSIRLMKVKLLNKVKALIIKLLSYPRVRKVMLYIITRFPKVGFIYRGKKLIKPEELNAYELSIFEELKSVDKTAHNVKG